MGIESNCPLQAFLVHESFSHLHHRLYRMSKIIENNDTFFTTHTTVELVCVSRLNVVVEGREDAPNSIRKMLSNNEKNIFEKKIKLLYHLFL